MAAEAATGSTNAAGSVLVSVRQWSSEPSEQPLLVPNVSVQLKQRGRILNTSVTSEIGDALFSSVSTGAVTAEVVPASLPSGLLPPWAQDQPTSYGDGAFYAREVEVVAGHQAQIVLTVFAPGRLKGYLLGPKDEGVSNGWVTLQSVRPGLENLVARATSDEFGRFELDRIYPGVYRAQIHFVRDHPYERYTRPLPQQIEIVPGDNSDLVLRIGESGPITLRGAVRDVGGNGVAGISVQVIPVSMSGGARFGINDVLSSCFTDESGSYQFEGLPSVPLLIQAGLANVNYGQPQDGDLLELPEPVREDLTTRGGIVEAQEILAKPNQAYRIKGRIVLDARAARVSLAQVVVKLERQGIPPQRLSLSNDGSFKWSSVSTETAVLLTVSVSGTAIEKVVELTPRAAFIESVEFQLP
ncbi:MAG: carboxypeptidase regulatory-like domain-containing protein [Nitrospira sp.]|nr:carboxypeptidase regulatory-like domain-containing protein [Nitrospira sp.]